MSRPTSCPHCGEKLRLWFEQIIVGTKITSTHHCDLCNHEWDASKDGKSPPHVCRNDRARLRQRLHLVRP